MRPSYPLLGLAVVVLAASAAAVQDSEPKAEQQFKNIQSFKGVPAREIIPAMEFISDSLNVKCDYCHTEDRSSDEKEAKGVARKMIAMTKEINDKNFNGRTQVTCATCHAGHPNPVGVPPVMGAAEVRVSRAEGVTADQVLNSYETAVGGSAACQAPKSIHLKGDTNSGTNHKIPFELYGEQPDRFTQIVHDEKNPVAAGYVGNVGWWQQGGSKFRLPDSVYNNVVHLCKVFQGSDTLPKIENPRVGDAKVDGKDMLVLRGATADKVRVGLFFDKGNGLLARAVYYQPTILGNIEQVYEFSDYKKVGGVQIPMTVKAHHDGIVETRHYTSAEANKPAPAGTFELPK